jgi:hypothetical protein
VLEELALQVRQLQATSDQLAALLAQANAGGVGPGPGRAASLLLAGQGRGGVAGARAGAGGSGLVGEEAVAVASAAVEQRVRRLEEQIGNLDHGMAKCLGQVVRLLQGLY